MLAAKLGTHALITLGASIIVWLITNLHITQMMIIWATFTVAALAADLLLLMGRPLDPTQPAAPSLFDLFEEIDDHNENLSDPFPYQRANWVPDRPGRDDHPHRD